MAKKKRERCGVCFNKRSLKTLLPCQHKLCGVCKESVAVCPFCRETISNNIRPPPPERDYFVAELDTMEEEIDECFREIYLNYMDGQYFFNLTQLSSGHYVTKHFMDYWYSDGINEEPPQVGDFILWLHEGQS